MSKTSDDILTDAGKLLAAAWMLSEACERHFGDDAPADLADALAQIRVAIDAMVEPPDFAYHSSLISPPPPGTKKWYQLSKDDS